MVVNPSDVPTSSKEQLRNTEQGDKFNITLNSIKAEILRVNGDLSKYKLQAFPLPSFPKWENNLYTLIGGTQFGKISLSNYKFNSKTQSFRGRINVEILDDFGVSQSDVKKAGVIPFSKGLRSMWYLQHVRGFRPFNTVYSRQFDIKF